ncbi:MAG: N-acetylmuramoyl-L-alanine amidase, partial [Lachnospiraceae bacterium]|nr:N-acetylmuramoyl-L-alanine amidase [Lachnospiraceae bacterium]
INAYNKEISESIIEKMTEQGYVYFDWNASLGDTVADVVPEQLIANGVETTLGRKKVVMLAHDIVYNTGICLNDLLDRLPEYEMKVIDADVEPIQF